ncbi:molybdopterin synthase catalytic subunit MoaE [Halioglobus maricola]|uniref:Molybdopterin synthase catalytic subunit n=1 Tax=Halioglobus maricola TaxID=2601894 RepID=A0A5P9NJL7_9GAMM|nr:molybdopterin synthase catalytic subunit MoaE [Halioglobus maricola]QFU76030.1 molybdopterin synthase catalytic subunit MoaE [Halioglobus maricola]
MPVLHTAVQVEDFDVDQLQSRLLQGGCEEGAVATFTGYVRSTNVERDVYSMELEHYPGMTEKCIDTILAQACKRWPVLAATVVHRVGKLKPGEKIVWVGVSSSHREASFAACEFVMDYLKTRAPFWKRELGPEGARWVEARSSDDQRASRW